MTLDVGINDSTSAKIVVFTVKFDCYIENIGTDDVDIVDIVEKVYLNLFKGLLEQLRDTDENFRDTLKITEILEYEDLNIMCKAFNKKFS